jgi:hypothetical protein
VQRQRSSNKSSQGSMRSSASNQALKLTRLAACQLGGHCSAENTAAHWSCTQSAVQLNAGVRQPREKQDQRRGK